MIGEELHVWNTLLDRVSHDSEISVHNYLVRCYGLRLCYWITEYKRR